MHIIKIFNKEEDTIPSCVFIVQTLDQVKLLPDKGIEINTGLKIVSFNKEEKHRAEITNYEKSNSEYKLVNCMLEAL